METGTTTVNMQLRAAWWWCKLRFIVIELELSYEPSAHLRWHTLVSVDGLEVGDQVVVVVSMRSGQRFIKRCKAAKTAAGTGTILAK